MAWYRCGGGGGTAEDGNNITYPVVNPSSENKLYAEDDIDAIAVALGQSLKVSDMAQAILGIAGGLHATRCIVHSAEYTTQ